MSQPRISVLINNYNYAAFLDEAVQSVLDQDYPNFEVIVVDDRSTDDSLQRLAAYGDRIRVVALEMNGGQAHGVNNGFPACTGEVVAMLDADDFFLPGKLQRLAARITEDPEAVIYPDRVRENDRLGRFVQDLPPRIPDGDIAETVLRSGGLWDFPPMSGLAFRASFLAEVLPEPAYPNRVSFDHHLATLATLRGRVAATQEVGTVRRLHHRNKYKNPERRERRDETLVDDMRRVERMCWCLNASLARLGDPRRLDIEKKLWYQTVRFWHGDMPRWRFVLRFLKLNAERNPMRALRRLRFCVTMARQLAERRAG